MACRTTPGVHWSWPMIGLFGVTVVAGAVGQAYTDAQTLSIQQDWVVVVARETGVPLGDWNASLRRIDLICKLASPVAFGLIMDFAGDAPMTRAATGAAVVGVWNLLAAPLEYCMRVDTYHFVPALHDQPNQLKKKPTLNFTQYFASWTEYFNHPTFLASFSFCALYMTVLTGDGLNSAYLQWRGVPLSLLGSINAMQNATSKLFYIAVLLVSVFCSDPREFVTLVSVSVGAVLSSAIGFTVWYARHVKK
ncbi:hypothetical protein DYB30_008112 [Aphanomyces astaci]|uniref:Solute carrier family 40 member n=1 Tax=Aphanomyces astaci TaxID=112090 RepID=A0A397CB71_APHAT|nr:hypothetical protein DYB30_008112 [Aphanomyces astaci]